MALRSRDELDEISTRADLKPQRRLPILRSPDQSWFVIWTDGWAIRAAMRRGSPEKTRAHSQIELRWLVSTGCHYYLGAFH
jgi:hypothetical protein